jgi:hypothetical protein
MVRIISILSVIASCDLAAIPSSVARTIPAGTNFVVKTANPIYTKDMVGKKFTAHLVRDIVVSKAVVAGAGTEFIGRVETSTKIGRSPLTVDLTAVKVGGKIIPVKTTGAFKPQSTGYGRRRNVTATDFVLPPGATMPFRLAQPLTI